MPNITTNTSISSSRKWSCDLLLTPLPFPFFTTSTPWYVSFPTIPALALSLNRFPIRLLAARANIASYNDIYVCVSLSSLSLCVCTYPSPLRLCLKDKNGKNYSYRTISLNVYAYICTFVHTRIPRTIVLTSRAVVEMERSKK